MYQYRITNVVKDNVDRRKNIYTVLRLSDNKEAQVWGVWFKDKTSEMFLNARIHGNTVTIVPDKVDEKVINKVNPLIDKDGWVKRQYLKTLDTFLKHCQTAYYKNDETKFKVIYDVNLNKFKEWFYNEFKFKPTRNQIIETFEAFFEGVTELDYILNKEDKILYEYILEKALEDVKHYLTDEDTKGFEVKFKTECIVTQENPLKLKCIAKLYSFDRVTYSEERELKSDYKVQKQEESNYDFWRNK